MQSHMFLVKAIVLIVLLLVGYQFYKGFRSSRNAFDKQGGAISGVSDGFVRALFSCMGHLAKSDGRVSEDEIRAARLIMHRLSLSPAQVRRAIHWFDDGKRHGFPLVQTVREAYQTLGVGPDSSNDDIKKAYRRLMNRNHPDKIAGENPDAAVLAEAERRTREVRGAYEMLKARRSIR